MGISEKVKTFIQNIEDELPSEHDKPFPLSEIDKISLSELKKDYLFEDISSSDKAVLLQLLEEDKRQAQIIKTKEAIAEADGKKQELKKPLIFGKRKFEASLSVFNGEIQKLQEKLEVLNDESRNAKTMMEKSGIDLNGLIEKKMRIEVQYETDKKYIDEFSKKISNLIFTRACKISFDGGGNEEKLLEERALLEKAIEIGLNEEDRLIALSNLSYNYSYDSSNVENVKISIKKLDEAQSIHNSLRSGDSISNEQAETLYWCAKNKVGLAGTVVGNYLSEYMEVDSMIKYYEELYCITDHPASAINLSILYFKNKNKRDASQILYNLAEGKSWGLKNFDNFSFYIDKALNIIRKHDIKTYYDFGD